MKVETGLQDGVRALRQDDQLLDLTLKVDGQEFRVHKVVLASVSDYFHAMLCGSLKESKSDVVELKEFSAKQVSRFLDFIYTGDNSVMEVYPKEMLECGVYFQMPRVIQECIQTLTGSLDVSNCLDLLSTFLKFGLDDTAQTIQKFMKANMKKVIAHNKPEELSYECIQAILMDWKNSEWELFQYLKSWLSTDIENRKEFMNDFMSQVRFKLMTPEEVMGVKHTVEYTDGTGSWRGLVDEASAYHQLAIHQKVLDKSLQSQVRWGKSLFVMDTGHFSYDASPSHVLCKDEKKRNVWKRYQPAEPPETRGEYPFVVEVNNFLIICSDFDGQHWQIFDPRTLDWSEIANLPRPKDDFALVHHGKHLYVLGGCEPEVWRDKVSIDSVHKYSFETNAWSSAKQMPVGRRKHAACVLNDKIYVSGGRIEVEEMTARVDSLDLSSQTWSRKASMLNVMEDHKMYVMKVKNQKSIVTIDESLNIDYYNPETDQWSNCNFNVRSLSEHYHDPVDTCVKNIRDVRLCSESTIVARGNILYLLKVCGQDQDFLVLNPQYAKRYGLCVKWRIPEDGYEILEFSMKNFPISGPAYEVESIATMLAFPARTVSVHPGPTPGPS